ncbi:MAG: helix-hairpin-helix domain-containing protein, partial [Bacteroidota bacterium]
NLLGFSKQEARGSVAVLFALLFLSILVKIGIHEIRSNSLIPAEEGELIAWVEEVKSSYTIRNATKQSPFEDLTIKAIDRRPMKSDAAKSTFHIYRKEKSESDKKTSEIAEKEKVIDLNSATAEQLQKTKGIGPVLSERIVKYRNALSGFADKNQLGEIYGLDSIVLARLSEDFTILSPPNFISLNADSAKVLARHPYIDFDLAWIIINYRKQHGDLHTVQDLRKIKAVDEELLQKLLPYLPNE